MRKLLGILAFAVAAALGASPAHALSPDDAIYLTKEGVEDPIIIAKICTDAVAWDLTPEEILYLREKGVSREVVEALIDPEGAAKRYGFTLGDPDAKPESYPDNYAEGTSRTSLIFSFGYYYGPLGVHYLYDPYFYPYYCSPGWGFSFSFWPAYYRANYFPYHWGYYSYPYYSYGYGPYCGYPYYGPAYPYYCAAPLPSSYYSHVKAPVRYRDYATTNPPPAYGSRKPNSPEQRLANSGRTVLDQYARDVRGRTDQVDVIRGGRADSRSGQKVGQGTAAERHLASRDATSMGRGSQRDVSRNDSRSVSRDVSRGDNSARVIRPGRSDGVQSVGRNRSSAGQSRSSLGQGRSSGRDRSSIGTPRTVWSPRSSYSTRGGTRAQLRTQGRSAGTPGTVRGSSANVIRGSGRAVPAPPKGSVFGAPSGRAPSAGMARGGRSAAPRAAAPRGGGRASGGGRR